jgi:hypothetical protein
MAPWIAPLVFALLPSAAAAFTAEQREILDDYDVQFLKHGAHCFGYEVALMRAASDLGLRSSQTPESKLRSGIRALNGYMFTDLPDEAIEQLILAEADRLADAGRQVAALLNDRVPLDDPRYEPARQGSASCGDMFDTASARGRWANENGLEIPR